jgi:hypothetical protein
VVREHLLAPFAIGKQHRFMRNDVDEPGHATACMMQRAYGGLGEQSSAVVAGNTHSMVQVGIELIAPESFQAILKRNALPQLAHRLVRQPFVEFRLPKQHNLQEFSFFGLEVRQ